MRNLAGSRAILAGIAGVALGAAAEAAVNRIAGTVVIRDGILWGAVLGVLVASFPNFARMGKLTVKSDKPGVNFAVGIGLFVLISAVLVLVFFTIFWLLARLLT